MFRPGAVLMEGYAAARPPMSVYMEEEGALAWLAGRFGASSAF